MSRSAAASPARIFWAAPICHPLPLLAALVLCLNDHWLKGGGLLPPLLTGKLSDFCGLFFFPALLLAAWRGVQVLRGYPPRPGMLATLLPPLLTGAVFVAANLSIDFNGWLAGWWGHKVLDPWDLVALPALAASWLWLRRCDARPTKPTLARPA